MFDGPYRGESRLPIGSIHTNEGFLWFGAIREATSLLGYLDDLKGRSVILMTDDQLQTAAALLELDGWARRIVICPPDLEASRLAAVQRDAEADALIRSGENSLPPPCDVPLVISSNLAWRPSVRKQDPIFRTEWVLLTSGTTGDPKMVVHSLATLTRAIPTRTAAVEVENWATFYDIRRYGGLQIFLRSCAGNGSLTLRSANETLESFFTPSAGKSSYPHFGHARALAFGSDERRAQPHRSHMRSPVGGNR